jgi:uncharacterized lipoprotein YddW (UPF0748 family)
MGSLNSALVRTHSLTCKKDQDQKKRNKSKILKVIDNIQQTVNVNTVYCKVKPGQEDIAE